MQYSTQKKYRRLNNDLQTTTHNFKIGPSKRHEDLGVNLGAAESWKVLDQLGAPVVLMYNATSLLQTYLSYRFSENIRSLSICEVVFPIYNMHHWSVKFVLLSQIWIYIKKIEIL
jgi:hypothetical protein